MPSVVVKIYSAVFKVLLKHKLLHSSQIAVKDDGYGALCRPSVNGVPANASFIDGVATKDIYINPFTSLSLRIFLPQTALYEEQIKGFENAILFGFSLGEGMVTDQTTGGTNTGDLGAGKDIYGPESKRKSEGREIQANGVTRRSSYGGETFGRHTRTTSRVGDLRRNSYGRESGGRHKPNLQDAYFMLDDSLESRGTLEEDIEALEESFEADLGTSTRNEAIHYCLKDRHTMGGKKRYCRHYQGYLPSFSARSHKKLPIIVQFHGGGFVTGSKDSAANDIFCRRMAKFCDAIVIAVGYRLAPEHKYPAAFDDGFEALCWLAKQANLAECNKSLEDVPAGCYRSRSNIHWPDLHRELVNSFGGSVVEPWLAAHSDPSRCVLLGVSSGGNIADHVARKAVLACKLLDPVKVVAQVLMYPFFTGSIPTGSEIKLANSYFYDKAACILAWKLFFQDGEYNADHPAANPLLPDRDLPVKMMPPTLTVVGELDLMKDRAIAYSEALRKVNIDAPVLEYKDAVHEFATLDFLVQSRQAEACAEDMAIWIRKYISVKGHEFSY